MTDILTNTPTNTLVNLRANPALTLAGWRSARGFTLIELLVVMSIFVLVLAIAVPSFSKILYSTERSQAGNQVTVALSAARAAAVSAEGMNDTAAVFFYEPATGKTRIGVYTVAGVVKDLDLNPQPRVIEREVFVPVPAYQPVQLPRGWMVRGFAPAGSVDVAQTNGARNNSGWYEDNQSRKLSNSTGNWVFPETGFYDSTKETDNPSKSESTRQTFMVRFTAGTGAMDTSNRTPVIVVDPSPSQKFRTKPLWAAYRLDKAQDLRVDVRRILSTSEGSGAGQLTQVQKRQLLGDESSDTVLARPVAELTVYDEKTLAIALKARGVNAATGSLYGNPADAKAVPLSPTLDTGLFQSFDGKAVTLVINNWIQGTIDKKAATTPSDARIVTVSRYSGTAQEVIP